MGKKYELTDETIEHGGKTLHRIRALRDFGDVKAGDLGGWIESKKNLSHIGDAWVSENARVSDNARVRDNAQVYGDAQVCGDAWVYGDAQVYDDAWVHGDAQVYGDADIQKSEDIITISGIGSELRTTTVFPTQNGVKIKCGCFFGTIDEFEAKVRKTHGDNKYAREYLAFAQIIRAHFGV